MTEQQLELQQYAEYMFKRNLAVFSQDVFKPIDFIPESFLVVSDDIAKAKIIILDRILVEKRKFIASIQQSEHHSKYDVLAKKCSRCKETKVISEFAPRLDNRTGYKYYNSYCSECELERRRISFSKSDQQHKSNSERQRRWYANHKKQKA